MWVRRFCGALALAAAIALCGCGGSRPALPAIGEPAQADDELSWLQRFAIDRLLDYRVWSGARAGYVALVARNGRVAYARTTGWADVEAGEPMTLDTRFQLASMTKPVTAVAALVLVDEERLALDDLVAKYIPAFAHVRVVGEREVDGGWTT